MEAPTTHDEHLARLATLLQVPAGEDYPAALQRLTAARDVFLSMLSTQLEHPLNAYAHSRPLSTFSDKSLIARQVNADLRQLSLAIRCPKTQQPAYLVADHGKQRSTGRFHLCATVDGKLAITKCSTTLLHLDLMGRPRHIDVARDHAIRSRG